MENGKWWMNGKGGRRTRRQSGVATWGGAGAGYSRIGKPTPVSPPVEGSTERGREGNDEDGAVAHSAPPTTSGQGRGNTPTERRGYNGSGGRAAGYLNDRDAAHDSGVSRTRLPALQLGGSGANRAATWNVAGLAYKRTGCDETSHATPEGMRIGN